MEQRAYTVRVDRDCPLALATHSCPPLAKFARVDPGQEARERKGVPVSPTFVGTGTPDTNEEGAWRTAR